jgi:uncharacterized metal-binding protein
MRVNKRGQVTIFIFLAILLVSVVVAYFVLRDDVDHSIDEEFEEVYGYYLSCIEDATERGVDLLGARGGYIEAPDFEAGSLFAPSGSQLGFMGQAVPYWLYVSGNGVFREQVPTSSQMASQLGDFVAGEILKCDFSDYESMGYDVYMGDVDAVYVEIGLEDVDVIVNQNVNLYKDESSVYIETSEAEVSSRLGKFYEQAVETFEVEKESMFLENYALDVMRVYAPVDGVDLSCVPKVVDKAEVRENLSEALVANVGMIKLNGDYYDLSEDDFGYFVVDDLNAEGAVRFVYDDNWPTKIEVYGDEVVVPIGLQEGLSYLGFCYLPYHYVYDVYFPVMVQFYDDDELFQFPTVVVISKNQAREALDVSGYSSVESEVCRYRNQEVEVNVYDMDLNSVEARISFECLQESCDIGKTNEDGELVYYFPQCLNGYVVARADGYADAKDLISTNSESVSNIVMKRKYNLSFDLDVDSALISFDGEDYSTSVMYPQSNSIELVEDYYNVTVYAYESSSLRFKEVTRTECVEVADGALGLFGVTDEECYDVTIPAMDIENAIIGGGKSVDYVLDSELRDAVELNLEFPIFNAPGSLEELQYNYGLLDVSDVYLSFS